MKQIPRDIAMKAAVGRIIDGEAWKAMEDGRASLEGSLWHLRQGWALEKAEQIIDAVKADLGTDKTLEHWRQEVGKLHSQNKRFRDALVKISQRDDYSLPMYTPGAMVRTAEQALSTPTETE